MDKLHSVLFRGVAFSRTVQNPVVRNIPRSTTRSCAFSSFPRSSFKKNRLCQISPAKRCQFCSTVHNQQPRFLHSTHGLENNKYFWDEEKELEQKKSTKPPVIIKELMTLAELSNALDVSMDEIVRCLRKKKVPVVETGLYYQKGIPKIAITKSICHMCGRDWQMEGTTKINPQERVQHSPDVTRAPPPDPSVTVKRPPVVTIMGHVDHGKTTLLDALRQSNIVDKEFGGITQHIGAFSVKLKTGDTITFLDTPGHAAFAAMRARGAHMTDIVVLVVAADDGVMAQTVQSVKFAKDAKVPVIVAINKCDKGSADINKTKTELMGVSLTPEDLGGDIQCVPISALKGDNLDALQEAIVAQAEMMELKSDPQGKVEGVVIESKVDTGRGRISSALVQRGTLKKGATLVSGTCTAKVKKLLNEHGKTVAIATPGTAVEIVGWHELPHPGDEILEVESETKAREVVKWRESDLAEKKAEEAKVVIDKKREEHKADYLRRKQEFQDRGIRPKAMYRRDRSSEVDNTDDEPRLSIIIKGDVDGSLEAILDAVSTYPDKQCKLDIISFDVGVVTEQDVEKAAAFNGLVYAFNTKTQPKALQLAQKSEVAIVEHNVIYKLIDDLRDRLTERLPPIEQENVIGEAAVQTIFMVTTERKLEVAVAGSRCVKGNLNKKMLFKLVRNGEILFDGKLSSLRHLKREVETIKQDLECGIKLDTLVAPQAGDTIICYEKITKEQTLDWDLHF